MAAGCRFFHKEGKGRGGGDGSGLGTGDFSGGGTPMELWTDVTEEGESKESSTSPEPHTDLLQRMLHLCQLYADYPTRVDFTEPWEANGDPEAKDAVDDEELRGSSQLSPSGMTPQGKMMRDVGEERSIRCKLDQFRASLRQHLTLVERWDGPEKAKLVEAVIDAVARWKPRGSSSTQQRQRDNAKTAPRRKQPKEEKEEEAEGEGEEEEEEEQQRDGDSTEDDSGAAMDSEEFG